MNREPDCDEWTTYEEELLEAEFLFKLYYKVEVRKLKRFIRRDHGEIEKSIGMNRATDIIEFSNKYILKTLRSKI
jgi:hypothetical protein